MKILLTGASGFIGSHVLVGLMEAFGSESVVALASKKIPNVNCVVYKSTKEFGLHPNSFKDITHIIHAGAFTPKNADSSNDLKLCFSNIEYLKELLSFNLKNLCRFINLSTLDVYAPTTEVICEKSTVYPVSLYGFSKLYCEEMVKTFTYKNCIEYLNLRIGHVYGPGEERYKKVLPLSIQRVLRGEALELYGGGDELRSFIYINDVVESIVNSVKSSVINIDINVVSGKTIAIKDLLSEVIKISGKPIELVCKELNYEKRDLIFNNNLLLSTLLFRETDLIDGLTAEYEYLKEKYENCI